MPPIVLKFIIKDRDNIIPISIIYNKVYSYNNSYNIYYYIIYITTSLHTKIYIP
jgi:hypothetical protein